MLRSGHAAAEATVPQPPEGRDLMVQTTRLAPSLERLDERLTSVEVLVQNRFDAIDRRFDAMDGKFATVNQRLDRIEAKVDLLIERSTPPS
jgi:hypothetical protein